MSKCESCIYDMDGICTYDSCPREFERKYLTVVDELQQVSKKCGARIIYWWRKCRKQAEAFAKTRMDLQREMKDTDALRARLEATEMELDAVRISYAGLKSYSDNLRLVASELISGDGWATGATLDKLRKALSR